MREQLPGPERAVTVTLVVEVLPSAQESILQSECACKIRDCLIGSEVWPLKREVRAAPEQVCIVDFFEYLLPENRIDYRKRSFDVVLVSRFNLFHDVNWLHFRCPLESDD